jgi:hypothetical protein
MDLRHYGFNSPTQLGQALERENLASVNYRYRDKMQPGGDYAWPVDIHDQPADIPYRVKLPTAVEAFRLVRCYVYQSCEHPTWKDSAVRRFCDDFCIALAWELARGSDVWSWDHPVFTNREIAA